MTTIVRSYIFLSLTNRIINSADLFGQLGSKNGFSCVRARKEDGVLPLYNETVAILFRHMGIL